jgi:hypothetical protein
MHDKVLLTLRVLHGLGFVHVNQSARGLRIYYNFMRPHMALDGKTPAQKARITDSSTPENWLSLNQEGKSTSEV